MKHILIESEWKNPAVELAQIGQSTCLTTMGADTRLRYLWEITEEDLNWCDVYLAIRPFSPGSVELARRIKKAGGFYVVYFDDDLLRPREGGWSCRFGYARRCVELADVIVGCNPVLLREYAALTKTGRYAIYDTVIDKKDIMLPREEDGKVKIVYAAGKGHTHFLDTYIKPVLNRFMDQYGDQVEFTFVGVEPDLAGIHRTDRIRLVPLMPLEKYRAFMQEERFDIGLAPLDDTPFCNRKYFNKYFEYTYAAIFGMYSNCLPYTLVIRDGENGFLVNNTPEDWYAALCAAIENPRLRKECTACAQQELRDKFTLVRVVDNMRQAVPEFLNYEKTGTVKFRSGLFRLKRKGFVAADRLYSVAYRLKTVGLANTVRQIISRLRNNV